MPIYKANNGQNIFDVALQLYGSAESAVVLLADNPTAADINFDIDGVNFNYTQKPNRLEGWLSRKKINIATNEDLGVEGKGFDEGFDIGFN